MNSAALVANWAQFLVSSSMLFILMAFLVECCLKLFDVSHPRTRAMLRCLPIIKLLLSLAFYEGEKSIFFDLNILSCKSYFKPFVRDFVFTPEQIEVMAANQIPLPQFLAMQFPVEWLQLFLITFAAVSIGLISYQGTQLLSAVRYLRKVCREASACKRKIQNSSLLRALEKMQADVLVSAAIRAPMAFGRKTILLPQVLMEQLSNKEFEALLAHEVEHLRRKDPLSKAACTAVKTLFWWIPMEWWLKRMEEDQEQACDASIGFYHCQGEDLASAVLKTLKLDRQNHKLYDGVVSPLISQRSHPFLRVQALLEEDRSTHPWILSYCGISVMITLFLLIGFRIC